MDDAVSTHYDDETMPSPWWPCPECGLAEFRTTVMFERGQWDEDDEDVYVVDDEQPEGFPTAIGVQDVECVACGHRFDIHKHYGWPSPETEAGL